MAYVGGLRDRLVAESVRQFVESGLDQLGWLGSNALIDNSLTIVTGPLDDGVEHLPNIVCIEAEDTSSEEAEMGSLLSEFRWNYAIDIYAEDEASGRHLCGDIRALLEGRFSAISNGPSIAVYDYTIATPSIVFYVELENIASGKQREYSKNYEKFWWTIVFDLIDTYADDTD